VARPYSPVSVRWARQRWWYPRIFIARSEGIAAPIIDDHVGWVPAPEGARYEAPPIRRSQGLDENAPTTHSRHPPGRRWRIKQTWLLPSVTRTPTFNSHRRNRPRLKRHPVAWVEVPGLVEGPIASVAQDGEPEKGVVCELIHVLLLRPALAL